jgi:large subunit ribosomal protein L9
LGSPIKTIGVFDTKIALHADVIVPVKVYVAQTQEEIDALVAGKKLTFGTKKVEEEPAEEAKEVKAEEKPAEVAEEKATETAE